MESRLKLKTSEIKAVAHVKRLYRIRMQRGVGDQATYRNTRLIRDSKISRLCATTRYRGTRKLRARTIVFLR